MVNIDYLYNPETAKENFKKNYFHDKKLSFQVIEKGIILPYKRKIEGRPLIMGGSGGYGGIIDSESNFIKSSRYCGESDISYTPPPESIQHSSETVIYLGMFYGGWGHDITDNINRVYFFKSDFFKSDFRNCQIVYIPKNGTIPIEQDPSFKQLLEILEIDLDRVYPITQPTQFDKIILPDRAFLSPINQNAGFTEEYRETIERVRHFALKNRTPTSIKKIYHFYGLKGLGEERIAEYFKSKGYEIVHRPEMLPLDEELNLFVNCENFASTGGSSAHNCLFLRDKTEAIFIPRAQYNFYYYQEIINQVCPLLNINYIDSSLSIFSPGIAQGNHFYILSKQLKRFFGEQLDDYEEEDFKAFLQYITIPLIRGTEFNPRVKKYYDPVLSDFMAQLKQHEDLIAAYDMPFGWDTFQLHQPYQPHLTYCTHVHMKGWKDGWKTENQFSNPLDQELDVLAIKVNHPAHKIYYSVYFNDKEGWSPEILAPEMAGTVGVRKPIYGMRVRLDEAGAKDFDILYRMHKFDGTWTPWAKNGENLYSHGVKVNSIQIKLKPVKTQPSKTQPEELDYQTFLLKNDEIYLQGQRPQIN